MWDMDNLLVHLEVGQAVYIYGKTTPAPPAGLHRSPYRMF
jgi:hypothetical protein